MPRKINDVLARFEQTIQANEAAGGGGGMYLTNVASTRKALPHTISSRNVAGDVVGPATRRMSVSAGTYRNFLQADSGGEAGHQARGDSTVSTASTSDPDWGDRDLDPFAEGENPDESENDSSEDDDEDRRVSRHRRVARPVASKRVGRLGNRKTRTTTRSDPRARNDGVVVEEEHSETSTNNEESEHGVSVSSRSGSSAHRAKRLPGSTGTRSARRPSRR